VSNLPATQPNRATPIRLPRPAGAGRRRPPRLRHHPRPGDSDRRRRRAQNRYVVHDSEAPVPHGRHRL